ncbi:MAG: 16S rRNA (cytosine(1402)-N(4))-methyltransferase RsmH [Clostridiales bacterium]|nr:16S rRNA (cytosine(1402)-N(4))-methyltransferase RsmH [Clostridiales bacterium]
MGFSHIPVMLEECIKGLNLKDGGIYFDGTIGGAGHSYQILKQSAPTGRLIATDLDDNAIAAATERLKQFEGRFKIYKSNYKNFEQVLMQEGVDGLDGVMLDFGVSSHQLDEESRGFSYMKPNAPLDMRMDATAPLTAENIVNEYSQQEIAKILKIYGEEKFAAQIAASIVKARSNQPITTCGQLVDIIESTIPKKFQQNGPCSRKSFQAIRIAVNGELDGLYDCVIGLTRKLKKGGRIAILTFHSLEDRIVKQAFKELETDCICNKNLPVCVCGKKKEIEIITKKPVVATVHEMAINSRSKCAKLRIAEKI